MKHIICVFFSILLIASFSYSDADVDKVNEDDPVYIIKTTMGDVYIELFKNEAPKTVKNFIELSEGKREFYDLKMGGKTKRPFYDGLIFHRVIKDFMIQGGCPLGNGTGSPGYTFEDEINADSLGLGEIKAFEREKGPHQFLLIRSQADYDRLMKSILPHIFKTMGIESQEAFKEKEDDVREELMSLSLKEVYTLLGYNYTTEFKSHPPTRGVIAMANSGPNTNGSQFFINLVDTQWLAGKHTVFGKVVKGMNVVDKIGRTEVDGNNKPIKDVKIISIRKTGSES